MRLAVLPDGQPGGAVPLQLHQMQQVIDVLLFHRLFQIFQHRQPVALQGMLGAGGGKGDGDGFVHLPYFLHRLHAGHAVHINVHQQQIELAGAEGFQQLLAAPELGAVRGNGGLFQQGKQGFPFLRQIVADGEVQWFHATPPLGIFLYYMAYAQKSQFVKYQFCRRLRHLSYWKAGAKFL